MRTSPYAKNHLHKQLELVLADHPRPLMPGATLALERITHECLATGLDVHDDGNSSDVASGFLDLLLGASFDGKTHYEFPGVSANALMHRINAIAAGAPIQVHYQLAVHVSYEPSEER